MPTPRRLVRSGAAPLSEAFGAIRAEHGIAVEHGPAALAEAAAAARGWTGGRRDATDLEMVTLDPPGSTDLDQAVHLRRTASGYRVSYAIADVAAFVDPGGALDRAAHERVMTVYCPDVRVPLHPPVLSEGAASLLPGQTRPAALWTLELDGDGEVGEVRVERAVVRSRAQLDYPTEQARLDAGPAADDPVTLLAEIGTRRAALERSRGGVSLGRPEQEVVAGPDGRWGLALRSPLPVEEHNAQISLMTGMAAAAIMLETGVGVLRTMPEAAEPDLDRLRHQAAALGVDWPEGTAYGAVLSGLDRRLPSTTAFLHAATALFRGAAWTAFTGSPPQDHRHGAVGAPYAHVTAPLRRLVDRYGTEVCLAARAGTPVPDWVLEALPTIGSEMAEGARRTSSVDRACTDVVEAAVLASDVGRGFTGVALDERTVQLADPAVVARCQGEPMTPGQPVRVVLTAADVSTRTVTFSHRP